MRPRLAAGVFYISPHQKNILLLSLKKKNTEKLFNTLNHLFLQMSYPKNKHIKPLLKQHENI